MSIVVIGAIVVAVAAFGYIAYTHGKKNAADPNKPAPTPASEA